MTSMMMTMGIATASVMATQSFLFFDFRMTACSERGREGEGGKEGEGEGERERVCVCVRERERERQCKCVCAPLYAHI